MIGRRADDPPCLCLAETRSQGSALHHSLPRWAARWGDAGAETSRGNASGALEQIEREFVPEVAESYHPEDHGRLPSPSHEKSMFGFLRNNTLADELVSPSNDRRYLKHRVSDRVTQHPAMLGKEERILPSFLAKQCAGERGAIVELGCYLGGSTVAILDGLEQAGALETGNGIEMHSYDLFRANEYMLDHSLRTSGVKEGESFEHVFRDLLSDWAPHVQAHAGNILEEKWRGGRIKLLYVDILWSWETNQHVFNQFYRALEPGSWLIHQDYVYSSYPWLPVTMEWLVERGYFSFRYFAEHSTVAFRCEKSPVDLEAHLDFQDMVPPSAKRDLLERSASRFRGYPSALLKLAIATLNAREGDRSKARSIIDAVKSEYSHPFVTHHVGIAERHL
jgi:hypothetical protein